MPHLRYALRTLVKSPGSSLIVTVTLAIAIGATTIIASTIDGVWHAIPAADTERLVFVASTDPRPSQAQSGMSGNLAMTGTSVPDLVDWTAQSTTVEQFGAFRYGTATLTGRDAPARVSLVRTTADMFSLWGNAPSLGRLFRADDGRIGATPVVLLSHRYWQDEFASDPSVIERTVLLDGVAHSIVGVVPRSIRTGIFVDTDLFVALPLDATRNARDERRLFVTARLKPGVTRSQAEADLAGIASRLKAQYPNTNAHTGVVVRPLIEQLGGQIQTLLLLLALIAVLVAGMACANVSNVVLAQAIGRQHELSVRTALGARRRDHVKQLAAESLLISLAAGVAGLVLGGWGLALLKWLAGPQARLFGEAALNWRIVAVGIATSFVLPLGFAFIPALQSWHPNPAEIKDGARHRRRFRASNSSSASRCPGRTRRGAARSNFIVRSDRLELQNDGERAQPARGADVPDGSAGGEIYARANQSVLSRVADAHRRAARVVSSGMINRLPVADREESARIRIVNAAPVQDDELPFIALATISPRYLETMRIALVRGRGFSDTDFVRSGAPVALVSEEAARRFWPGRDAVGAQATIVTSDMPETPLQVVGIVANVRRSDADQRTMPQVYVPSPLLPERAMAVVVRSAGGDPTLSLPAIRAQAATLDPAEPIFDAASMEQVLFNDQASLYTLAGLLGAIAFVALCLAGVGIYGVVSYMVTLRTREIGLRMALGARPGTVLRMVIRQSVRPVAGGGLVGVPAAVGLVYAMSGVFSLIDVRDPANYIGVVLAISGVAVIATYLPARHAAQIDPLVALRQE